MYKAVQPLAAEALLQGQQARVRSSCSERNPRPALKAGFCYSRWGQTTGVHGGLPGRATRRPTPCSSECQTGSSGVGSRQGHPETPLKVKTSHVTPQGEEGTGFLPALVASSPDLTSWRTPKALPLWCRSSSRHCNTSPHHRLHSLHVIEY